MMQAIVMGIHENDDGSWTLVLKDSWGDEYEVRATKLPVPTEVS